MPLRVSIDQVNPYVLHKQHLWPRSRSIDVVSVVQGVGPLRAGPPTGPHFSLWSRMEGFCRQQLDSALYERRTLVRVPSMHAQLNVIPSEEFPAYYQATRSVSPEGLQGFVDELILDASCEGQASHLQSAELVQRVLEVMSARGPSTVDELARFLPLLDVRIPHDPEHPELGSSRLGARLLPAMCAQGFLVRAQARGSWRSDLYSYAALSSWLPGLDLNSLSRREALQRVVLSYVSAFGPVTISDASNWLGGVRRRQIVAALMSLEGRLVRLEILGSPGNCFMLKEQVPALLSHAPEERSACLLPPRDNLGMAYSGVGRFVAEAFRERMFDRGGESLGTVWLDGRVVGLWWAQVREGRIVIRFFEGVDAEGLAMVGEEARRLGEFLAHPSLDIEMGTYRLDEKESPAVPVGVSR